MKAPENIAKKPDPIPWRFFICLSIITSLSILNCSAPQTPDEDVNSELVEESEKAYQLVWSDKFHIWKMEWTVNSIKLFLDDELLNTIPLSKVRNQRGDIQNPFRETKHYLLLNLAIGGTNGGIRLRRPFLQDMKSIMSGFISCDNSVYSNIL